MARVGCGQLTGPVAQQAQPACDPHSVGAAPKWARRDEWLITLCPFCPESHFSALATRISGKDCRSSSTAVSGRTDTTVTQKARTFQVGGTALASCGNKSGSLPCCLLA